MAKKDTVFIDIQTSDGGSMQRVAVSAKKLGIALDDVGGATGRAGKGSATLDRNMKGLSKQSSNSTKNFSKMAQGMTGTLVPAYAVLAANVFAITAAFAFLKKAADFRVMQESQIAFTGATGVGMRSLTSNIQEASGAMLDFQSASESASIGIASGLGAGQIEQLAAGAGNLSKILGRDVTDSFNRLVKGVTKAEPELLDELGITLRLTDAQTKYAATLGKSVKDLTIYEKKQAVFVEVQGQLENKYNAVAKATDVQANAVAKLGVAFDKIMKVVREYVSLIAEPVAEFFTKNIGSMTAALALLAVPIVRSIIPGLDSWAEKSKESAQAAKESYKSASDELEELNKKQADIKSGKAIADTIDKPSAGIQAGFGKGKMKKNQAEALLRNAKRTNKKLKHLDDRQLAAYRIHLKAQIRGHHTTMEKIYLQRLDLDRKIEVQNKKMVARWEIAMAVMKGATAKFTKGVDLLFKGMGLIGIALLVKDVGHDLLMYMGFFSENKGLRDLIGGMDELADKTRGVIKEYSKFNSINETMRDNAKGNPSVEFDNLALLGREGKMIESIGGMLLKNLGLKEDELKVQADIMAGAKKLTTEQVSLQQKLKTSVKAGTAGSGGWALPSFDMSMPEGIELDKLFKGDATAALNVLKDLNTQEKVFTDNSATWAAAAEEIAISQALLSAESVVAATTMKTYLDNLPKGQLTTLQSDYLTLVNVLAKGDALLPKQVIEFERLTKALAEVGNEAVGSAQAIAGLNTQYDTVMAGITQFQTKHSELIRQYENEKDKLEALDAVRRSQPDIKKKIDGISDALTKLNKLRDLEIKFALKKLKIDLATAKISRGATKYQKAEIQRSNKIAHNLNLIAEKNAEIVEAKARDNTDLKRVEQLQLQRDLVIEQNKELERQRDLGAAVMDAMMQSIENNIQKSISDILKGTESSFKDMALNFAKSVVDAMIDAFAQNITEKIMNMFGMKTQAQKTKEAVTEGVEEGAKTHAAELKKVLDQGTLDFAKALDDAAGRFADAIREACHTCSCSGGVMPTPTTSSADVYAKSMGSDDFRSKIPPLETPLSRTIPSDMSVTTSDGVSTQTAISNRDGISVETQMQRNAELEEAQLKEINIRKEGNTSLFDTFEDMGTRNDTSSGKGGGVIIPTTTIKNGKKPGAEESIPGGEEFLGGLGEEFENQTNGSGGFLSSMGGLFGDLGGALGGLLGGGGGGGGAGGLISTVISSFFAKGGVAQGGFRKYANGGIATRPHLGLVGEGRMNEAIVPLPDGKSIPVSMPKNAGGGMQNNNVGVTVNIDKNGQASTNTESDSQAAAKMGEAIANAVQEELLNQKRNGGILSPYGVG